MTVATDSRKYMGQVCIQQTCPIFVRGCVNGIGKLDC